MDGGAWWATVCGVTKSRTRLRDFTFTFTFPSSKCLLRPILYINFQVRFCLKGGFSCHTQREVNELVRMNSDLPVSYILYSSNCKIYQFCEDTYMQWLWPLCMLPLHGLPTLTSTDCKDKKDKSKEVVAVVRHAVSEGCATVFQELNIINGCTYKLLWNKVAIGEGP